MTQYNTRNPIGSTDPRDLLDNAQNIDEAVNSTDDTWVDRFGDSRPTLRGIEQAFNDALKSSGYELLSDYAPGITVTKYNQIIRENGQFWRASLSTTLPYTTTGTGMPEGGAFVSVGDAVLRQELVQPVATYNSVADMRSDVALTVGRKCRTLGYYTPGDGGGNDYEIVSGGTGVVDGGSFISLPAVGLQAKGLFVDVVIYVKQFGAKGDNVDDTPYFAAAAAYSKRTAPDAGFNRGLRIIVTAGTYKIIREIQDKANWVLYPGAYINGLGGVPPTYSQDTSRLTGSVLMFSGVSQFSTIEAGDNSLAVQKYANKGFIGEITGRSSTASAGLCGTSHSSASNVVNQGCVGTFSAALNDNTTVQKPVWGSYIEGHRAPGVTGHVFCEESTTFNRAAPSSDSPNRSVFNSSLVYNHWITTGGSPKDFPDCKDVAGAIGILGKGGARFNRGIIFKKDSLATTDAVALPPTYGISWFGGTALPGDSELKTAYIASNTANPNGSAQISLAIMNSNEEYTGIYLLPSSIAPRIDNSMAVGNPAYIFTEVYAQNTNIQTSDEREKTLISDLTDAELAVARKLRIRRFKWKDAVDAKGSEKARWHIGFIAQEVIEAFRSEGLDPFEYGAVCYDAWDDVYDENGELVRSAGDRYSLRTSELFALYNAAGC